MMSCTLVLKTQQILPVENSLQMCYDYNGVFEFEVIPCVKERVSKLSSWDFFSARYM